jgi:hypothetical protein
MEYKKGQRVRCINQEGEAYTEGNIYVVKSFDPNIRKDFGGTIYTEIDDKKCTTNAWGANNFELIADKQLIHFRDILAHKDGVSTILLLWVCDFFKINSRGFKVEDLVTYIYENYPEKFKEMIEFLSINGYEVGDTKEYQRRSNIAKLKCELTEQYQKLDEIKEKINELEK